MAENKEFILDLLEKTIQTNIDSINGLNLNDDEDKGPIPENDNFLTKFNNLIFSVDTIVIEAIEQANNLINAKVNAHRNRISQGIRSDRDWGLLSNGENDLIEYQAGITTEFLYGIKSFEYNFTDPEPFKVTTGITTVGITTQINFVGLNLINVGFGSLGTINQIHSISSPLTHYNVIGITTLSFTGGITVNGIGSTGASFTNVSGFNYPDTYLIANKEILRVAGVAGTFVGFGINGEYRGFDKSQIVQHTNNTTFDIVKKITSIGSLSTRYPEILSGEEFVKLRDGNYITLKTGAIVNPRLYLKVNQINNSAVGVSSGDYIGVGTELFFVTGIETNMVKSNITTLGIGSFIEIVQSIPVTYNIGINQFPSGSSNIFSPNENGGSYGVSGVSAGAIAEADALVASTVSAASTASTIIDSIEYLMPALNVLRDQRSDYKIRKYGYDNSIILLNTENKNIGIAVTFLNDKNYNIYMS